MKNQFYLIITMSILCSFMSAQAQEENEATSEIKKNYAKINLPGLAIRNYGLQYERVVSKRVSFAISYRFMPNGPMPFKSAILKSGDNTPEAEKTINSIQLSNSAITPEIRFYLGKKGYGRGFYFAPFYRYVNFKASGGELEYEGAGGSKETMSISGDLKGSTFGLMLGAQWALGKNICLDWFILGPHYGTGSGSLKGLSSMTLDRDEQNEVLSTLQEIDIPLIEETYSVNSNSFSMSLKGPWAGIRAGLSLGIRF